MNILFLCVANSARSQMAEGLGKVILGKTASVSSAGSLPAKEVNPIAIKVMAEKGFNVSNQRPKSIERFDLKNFDLIITLCAEEICPVTPRQVKVLHWPLPDPARPGLTAIEQLLNFREIRDELHKRISGLIASGEVTF